MRVVDIMTRDPETIGPLASISEACRRFDLLGYRHLPVVEHGRVVGLLADEDAVLGSPWMSDRNDDGACRVIADAIQAHRDHLPSNNGRARRSAPSVVRDVMRPGVWVARGEPGSQAAWRMVEENVRCLFARWDDERIGLVSTSDVIAGYGRALQSGTTPAVDEVMDRELTCPSPEGTLEGALELCYVNGVRHLPVVQQGRVLGTVSEWDLRRTVEREVEETAEAGGSGSRVAVARATVALVQAARVCRIESGTPLHVAATEMARSRLSSLPVLKRGRYVGLLTQEHVLRHISTATVPALADEGLESLVA